MAKLPNGERALIPMEKLTDYCSNPDHARRKDKARVFTAVLGTTRDSAHVLEDLVRQAARDGDITKEARTLWGQYYRVDWVIPSRVDVVLRTIWEIAPGRRGSAPAVGVYSLRRGSWYGTPQTAGCRGVIATALSRGAASDRRAI
jgi:hypothetical protein